MSKQIKITGDILEITISTIGAEIVSGTKRLALFTPMCVSDCREENFAWASNNFFTL